jgi:hypothetical protein
MMAGRIKPQFKIDSSRWRQLGKTHTHNVLPLLLVGLQKRNTPDSLVKMAFLNWLSAIHCLIYTSLQILVTINIIQRETNLRHIK